MIIPSCGRRSRRWPVYSPSTWRRWPFSPAGCSGSNRAHLQRSAIQHGRWPGDPADLEPLVAALVTLAVDTVGIGVAYAGRMLPVPKLTRHATLALAFLDNQQ